MADIICGVCGNVMQKINNSWVCKMCERFFGISSEVAKCSNCGNLFGRYESIEMALIKDNYHINVNKWMHLCPNCKQIAYLESKGYKFLEKYYEGRSDKGERLENYFKEIKIARTIEGFIKNSIKARETTKNQLIMSTSGLISEEFIQFCLGKN